MTPARPMTFWMIGLSILSLVGCSPRALLSNSPIPANLVVFPPSPEYDVPAKLIKGSGPAYPPEMLRLGIQGSTLVEFTVSKDGTTKNVASVWSDRWEFTFPAVAAVKQWVFEPSMKDGRPVEVSSRIRLYFRLDGGWGTDHLPLPGGDPSGLFNEIGRK